MNKPDMNTFIKRKNILINYVSHIYKFISKYLIDLKYVEYSLVHFYISKIFEEIDEYQENEENEEYEENEEKKENEKEEIEETEDDENDEENENLKRKKKFSYNKERMKKYEKIIENYGMIKKDKYYFKEIKIIISYISFHYSSNNNEKIYNEILDKFISFEISFYDFMRIDYNLNDENKMRKIKKY